jgi:hypothetical protein
MRLTRETHVDCLVARDVYIIGPLHGLETMALARTRSEILNFVSPLLLEPAVDTLTSTATHSSAPGNFVMEDGSNTRISIISGPNDIDVVLILQNWLSPNNQHEA